MSDNPFVANEARPSVASGNAESPSLGGHVSASFNSLEALARNYTSLDPDALLHVRRLTSSWGMLSDLSFSDLLLAAPVASSDGSRFVIIGQARPTTSQTFHTDVMVGRVFDEFDRPMVARAWRRNEIVESDDVALGRSMRARVQCIPVVVNGEPIAILSRESPLTVGRRPGQLERMYVECFNKIALMIHRGQFPFEEGLTDRNQPRIGDGSLILDSMRKITFASPNAMNAMHRMGFHANIIDSRLEEIGIPGYLVRRAFEHARPFSDEIEPRLDVVLSVMCVPLLDQERVSGALVMIRDITDLRRLDRLLSSKDASIREIHHRVKNNLQTVTSLLALQARRLEPGPAQTALEEAHRRIRSIAVVHEILSREASDQVAFNDIIEPLVHVAAQGASATETKVNFEVEGDSGDIDATFATPLAVVLAELMANAVEHAFPGGRSRQGGQPIVRVELLNDGQTLHVSVRDNGVGDPATFADPDGKSKTLGISIVRSLVESQLEGTIAFREEDGTTIDIAVPLRRLV